MRTYDSVGLAVSQVWLPREGVDLARWAVVACDQFTSEPAYWEQVEQIVNDEPSTLRLIFPEVYLEQPEPEKRIKAIHHAMNDYLDRGVLEPHDGMIYVERTIDERTRHGLVVCVDLEQYDFSKGSTSLIRATEGTIVERLPPRIAIRQSAPLELPHIMVLIDDPQNTVIGPVQDAKDKLPRSYDLEAMMDGGHLTGHLVNDAQLEAGVISALEQLKQPSAFASLYGLDEQTPPLLYAMGDGNHSLATAKAIWEKTKEDAQNPQDVMNDPTRYALVELVNLHDASLVFEPIHRVVFGVGDGQDLLDQMSEQLGARWSWHPVDSVEALERMVLDAPADLHRIGVVRRQGLGVIEVTSPTNNLAVGTLQRFLDGYMAEQTEAKLDYVHGSSSVQDLGRAPGNIGFFLPPMPKDQLFKSVIVDGALPRKTFSMGEANEKRYYMEARRLT